MFLIAAAAVSVFNATWLGDTLHARGLFPGPSIYWLQLSYLLFLSTDVFAFAVILVIGSVFSRSLRTGNIRDFYLAGREWPELLAPFWTIAVYLFLVGSLTAQFVAGLLAPDPRSLLLLTGFVSMIAAVPIAMFAASLIVAMNVLRMPRILQMLLFIAWTFGMHLAILGIAQGAELHLYTLFAPASEGWKMWVASYFVSIPAFVTYLSIYLGTITTALVLGCLSPIIWRLALRTATPNVFEK